MSFSRSIQIANLSKKMTITRNLPLQTMCSNYLLQLLKSEIGWNHGTDGNTHEDKLEEITCDEHDELYAKIESSLKETVGTTKL